ncbi:MAG TPA: trypsin-like peptidase domain-containing protein [Solirubrobacterales bacterium]|nr:trypsin-like peptidase domain-containing protein [Solirubrobacterales bacterium]
MAKPGSTDPAGTSTAPAGCRPGGGVAAALAALLAAAIAPAPAAADGGAVPVEQTAAEVRDYWTPERMRAATPVARVLEDRDGERPARQLSGAAGPSRAAEQVSGSSAYPARTHGKVFFRIPGQGNFVCSGTVVRSRGRNVVLTAGHCVYDDLTRTFAANWMFVPAFRDGERPFGEWVAHRLATTSQFRAAVTDSERWDVGIAIVGRNRNGRGVQDRVGARRIGFNRPRDQSYRAFGYPAASPFDGRRMYRCDSPYRGDDPEFDPPRPMRIDCDMTGGSSGGGWVSDGGFVASVISYAYECPVSLPLVCADEEEGKLFGPFFGNVIRNLYRANRGRARHCGDRVVTQRGGRGGNSFTGTPGPDAIHGGGGDDILRGQAGADAICGGAGADRIFAGHGADRVFAGAGADRIFAQAPGRNRIDAVRGRNRIRCGPGRDRVVTNRISQLVGPCDRVIRR